MIDQVRTLLPFEIRGRVASVQGLAASVTGFAAPLGAICEIQSGGRKLRAEVVGFRESETLIFPYGDLNGVRRGDGVDPARAHDGDG